MIDWTTIIHFRKDEFIRPELLRPKMIQMLDDLRRFYGSQLVVSSSWRDADRNAQVGGASDSSHVAAYAPDGFYSGIDLTTPANLFTKPEYFSITKAAYAVGFRRIGLYKDFKHLHVDSESRLPQEVLWID